MRPPGHAGAHIGSLARRIVCPFLPSAPRFGQDAVHERKRHGYSFPRTEVRMAWHQFAFRLIVALILGALVGAERQWRQRTAGLRTNCLVAVGSAIVHHNGRAHRWR